MAGQGGIGLFTIATIFVVVFAAMYGGVQLSEGRLLPDEGLSPAEERFRAELTETLNERRAERGLGPIGQGTWTSDAQDTAEQLARTDFFGNRSTVVGGTADAALPNYLSRCTQVPVKLTVGDPAWEPSDDGRLPRSVVTRVAREVADHLTTGDPARVVFRGGQFFNRLGVAIAGDELYVVYRSCTVITD